MIRLSEEQMAILSCYSGTKEEVIAEIRKAVPFIEDVDLTEMTEELLMLIKNMPDDGFVSVDGEGMLDIYYESGEGAME